MLDQEDTAKDVLDIIYELFISNNGDLNKPEPLQRLIDFLAQSSQLIDEIDLSEETAQPATESAICGLHHQDYY